MGFNRAGPGPRVLAIVSREASPLVHGQSSWLVLSRKDDDVIMSMTPHGEHHPQTAWCPFSLLIPLLICACMCRAEAMFRVASFLPPLIFWESNSDCQA